MVTNPSAGRTPPSEPPVDQLSYEQARDELVAVVARLEAGGETLEGSLALWERGEQLAARCQQWLDGARARLDAVRASDDAEATDDAGSDSDSDPGTGTDTSEPAAETQGTEAE